MNRFKSFLKLLSVLLIISTVTSLIGAAFRFFNNNPEKYLDLFIAQQTLSYPNKAIELYFSTCDEFLFRDYYISEFNYNTAIEIYNISNDLDVSEIAKLTGKYAPITESFFSNINDVDLYSNDYVLFDNKSTKLKKIKMYVGESIEVNYYHDGHFLFFCLDDMNTFEEQIIYHLDKLVINGIYDTTIATIKSNKITGLKKGSTKLFLYHDGEPELYKIDVLDIIDK